MARELAAFLSRVISHEVHSLRALTEERAQLARGSGKWCPKEELGHLIDSASNNHIRFVRAVLESEMHGPGYAQNDWVRLHDYVRMPWDSLVDFWHRYNTLLATLVENIPEERLGTPCFIGSNPSVTLGFLIEDYILHLQHHIDLLLRRDKVTSYPGAAARV